MLDLTPTSTETAKLFVRLNVKSVSRLALVVTATTPTATGGGATPAFEHPLKPIKPIIPTPLSIKARKTANDRPLGLVAASFKS